jgi:hypothetical protein
MKFCKIAIPSARFWLIFLLGILSLYNLSLAQPSVLASGDWYKIGTTQKGIYKIDRAFLQKAGINIGTVQPGT